MSIVDFNSLIQINLFISFTSFSFYCALMSKKYDSIQIRICFKKGLLVAGDQLPNKIPVTYFSYSFMENIVKVRSYYLKTKCLQLWQVLIWVFRVCYFE